MRRFVLLVLAVAFALPATLSAQMQGRGPLVTALDSLARAHAANEQVAGVSVAVVRGADTLLLAGYGAVDLEWDVPTPPDARAVYEIGSVTKQFTAAALLTLVEQGKVDLDADFTEYLPEFDAGLHEVPVRRLLDHTSGIQGYTEMPVFGAISIEALPRDTLVSLVEAEPFLFEPGTGQIYNNSAYFLLGLLIEEVSGMSYADFVAREIFGPLGMEDSFYCSEEAVRSRRAHGYDAGEDGLVRKAYLDHTWPYAAGSLCSSAPDLVRWLQALHGGEVLSPDSYHAMTTPRPLLDGTPLRYAMGLSVSEDRGRRMIGHNGGINGFLSETRYYPDPELMVIVLQNTAGPVGPGALATRIVDRVLGPLPEIVAVPFDGDLDALAGEYHGPMRGGHVHMVVSRDGDQLVLRPKGGTGQGLRPRHIGDGVWRQGGIRLWFDSADGVVTALRLEQGGHSVLQRLPG